MKKYGQTLLSLAKNRLIGGSLIVFVGSMVSNIITYLFHLAMGRFLGPVDYGTLSSLISISYLLGIPFSVLSLTVIKEISALKGAGQEDRVAPFYHRVTEKSFTYSLLAFFVFLCLSPFIARYLHLKSVALLWLTGTIVFIGLFSLINLSALQALLRFKNYTAATILTNVSKLALTVFAAVLGFKVSGVLTGIILSSVVGWWISNIFLNQVISAKKDLRLFDFNVKKLSAFAFPALMATLALTSLYTTDIVLAKHFLAPREAGLYGALAIFGKIIFFATSPITVVMFPMVSGRHAAGRGFRRIFFLSFFLVALITAGINGFYKVFPGPIVNLLYGPEYLEITPLLWKFGLFLGFYSLCAYLINFFLSIRKLKVVIFPLLAAFAQIVFLHLFHAGIKEMILVSIYVSGLLLVSLLLYYLSGGRAGRFVSQKTCLIFKRN